MEDIEELVELFRSSGGKFENAGLGYREVDGFYVYTLDSNQDTVVSCPPQLLVDIDDVDVSQDGFFIINTDRYENNIEFLEKYFAFHFNRKMLDRYIENKRQIDSLSSRDLSLISRVFPSHQRWSGGCGDLEFAKEKMVKSHQIDYFGKMKLSPFVTFLNHAKYGMPYNITKQAISVSGKFSDEVFAFYYMGDVLSIMGCYGFIADTEVAYSLPMAIVSGNGTRLTINRKPWKTTVHKGLRWPQVDKEGGTITISWFPLYVEKASHYPASVAQMVAREVGQSAEGFLYANVQANLNALLPVAFELRDSENPYVRLLSATAQRQLEVIGGMRK